jgi:hypothetical protein
MTAANMAASQNAEVGKETLALARQQYADSQAKQAEYDPIFKELVNSSLKQQQLANEQSATQWDQYKTTWMPIENKLADTATNYDTAARRDDAAAAAGADMGIQYGNADAALTRDLGRSGLSLSSGKALALKAGSRLDQAKATAGAETGARRQIEQTGISLVDNAARFGRNMPSTGIATAQQGLAAGQSAQGAIGTQQQVLSSALSGVSGLYGTSTGATQSAINNATNQAQITAGVNASNQQTQGAALGTAASLAAMFMLSSSKAKDVEGDVDPDAALDSVRETPVKAWRYKGDKTLRLGPMAEDVQRSTGLGDGTKLDIATELGTLRAAVQGLAKKVDGKSPKQLSLRGD